MRKNVVLPFRIIRPGSEAVRASDWYRHSQIDGENEWITHGGHIKDWSYDTPLLLGREIKLDFELLLEELDLAGKSPVFELINIVRASNLGIRWELGRAKIDAATDHVCKFEHELDSSNICEVLVLTSTLVLKSSLPDAPKWSPSTPGSICWTDETQIFLEGTGSRFPMQDVEFSKNHRLPDNASWHLDWRPGFLHYSFNSAVRLLLNSEKEDFFKRIQEGDDVLIEQVMSSITSEICSHLLSSDDFVSEEIEYPEGSLGQVARSWLLQAIPGKSLSDISSAFRQTPSSIHTALRGMTGRI